MANDNAHQRAEDHYYAALDLVSEGQQERALDEYQKSLDADPVFTEAMHGMARTLQDLNRLDEAIAVASRTLSMLPFHAASTLWSLVFYVLGFLLFGVLMMGTGSLGQNLKEVQQYGMMWSLASVVPLMFLSILVPEPNGVFARVLSFIPLTAPATMFMRLHSVDPPPWWETTLSAALLAVSAWFALKVMARLFRVGLLLYGKRPTIPAILKMLRRPS